MSDISSTRLPPLVDDGFTVVVVNHNLGLFLERAVDSALGQTLGNVHVHVVDDRSDDRETIEVLERLRLSGKVQVTMLKRNHGGPAVPRSMGVWAAKTGLVCCLDADDVLDPTYLEKARDVFRSRDDVGIVTSHMRFVNADGHGEFIEKCQASQARLPEMLLDNVVHTASCFRRDASVAAGMYDAGTGLEDWDHWLSILDQGWKVGLVPEPLFLYQTGRLGSRSRGARSMRNLCDRAYIFLRYCRLLSVRSLPRFFYFFAFLIVRKIVRNLGKMTKAIALCPTKMIGEWRGHGK